MNNKIAITFNKLLGNGRAWVAPQGFTEELLEVLISPLTDLRKRFGDLKHVHFTTLVIDENNIINNEELFDIKNKKTTLEERAEDVDLAWQMLSGNSNYKTLENYLQKKGYELFVIENTSAQSPDLGTGFDYNTVAYKGEIDGKTAQYGGHTSRIIGNGFLNVAGSIKDPAQFINGKNSFYIKGYFDPTDSEWDNIIDIVLRLKQAHEVAICLIAERKLADNGYYNTTTFADEIDGGYPDTTFFIEKLNPIAGI